MEIVIKADPGKAGAAIADYLKRKIFGIAPEASVTIVCRTAPNWVARETAKLP